MKSNDELGNSESTSKQWFKLLLKKTIFELGGHYPLNLRQRLTNWGSGFPELSPFCDKALEHINTRLGGCVTGEMYLRNAEDYNDVEQDIAARAFRIKLMEECYALSDAW